MRLTGVPPRGGLPLCIQLGLRDFLILPRLFLESLRLYVDDSLGILVLDRDHIGRTRVLTRKSLGYSLRKRIHYRAKNIEGLPSLVYVRTVEPRNHRKKVVVKKKPTQNSRTKLVSIRLAPEMIAELQKIAEELKKPWQTVMKALLADCLNMANKNSDERNVYDAPHIRASTAKLKKTK